MKMMEADVFRDVSELESHYKYESWKRRQSEKRKEKIKKNRLQYIVVLITVVLIVLALMTISSATSVDAATKVPDKSFTSVTVQAGDTLWSIAEEYLDARYYTVEQYIDEVMSMNRLTNDIINTGDALLIPVILNQD